MRVRAAGINPIDTFSRGHSLPHILSWDISGEVVALGSGVTQFVLGDEVYGMPRFPQQGKAYSEYVSAPVVDLALKPSLIG